jgi:CHAT domain-containing protein/tetratricopeptide (TPR) repeat protein
MAFVLKEMGYYETSDKYYAVALPKLAYYLGSSSEQYSSYLKHYVDLKVDMGDYVNAHAYNEALLFYYKGMKGEKDEMYLACLTNKGRILQGQGKYNEAVFIFANLVEATRINFPNDTLNQTVTLNNLAYCYRLLGNNSSAEQYFIEAYRLQTSCKSIPLNHQASLLSNLGLVYKAKADYANAEKCFLKSIELYQKANMNYNVEMANPCNNLGDMYRMLGNFRDSKRYLEYSLEIRQRTSGEEHEYYANALNNIGLLYYDNGYYDDAEQLFIRCEQIYKAKLGEQNDRYSVILSQLGAVNAAKKDYSKALEYKNKALRLMETTIGKQHERYALFLSGKGQIESTIKDYKGSLNSYIEAASLLKNNYGETNYNYLDMIHSLAAVNSMAGNYKEARNLHLKSIYGYKKVIAENLAFMGDDEKASFYLSNSGRFETFETFVVDQFRKRPNEKDDSLLRALIDERLWTKSILLNESSSMYHEMQSSKDTSVQSLFANWVQQKKNLQQFYQLSKGEIETNQIDLDNERNYLNELEKQLTKTSSFSKPKEYLNFETLKKKLNKNELAVEIIRNYVGENDSLAMVTYAALLVGKDYSAPKIAVFDSTSFFDTVFIERYKFNIHSNKTDLLSYNRYFKPLEKYLNGVTKIYFSPDGVYQQMNAYTLYDPIAKKYLIDKMEVEQVTSLNDLQKEVGPASTNLSAVLFGYPDYEWKRDEVKKEEKENLIASRFGFSELPELLGTKKETEEIFSVFNANKWDAKLYLAKQATEEQVKSTVSPTILHIATHGFFLPNLDYSDEKILGFETESAKQNPLLRSGVIMAGAASKDTMIEKKEDGILTAYEASLLNLQNTELVTLSACETGLGDQVMNGQGVYGLQRAFLTAGAKSVLMSLWVVDDNATKELMTNFYSEWIKNYSSSNKRSSFRKAQLEVKKRYPSPYYWGAFVMIGK